jgi:SAM-dependent methyltransferase
METDAAPERARPIEDLGEELTRELAETLRALVDRLREDEGRLFPEDESWLRTGSMLRRRLKATVFGWTRAATRRYDRLTSDLAAVAAELASRLADAEDEGSGLRDDLRHLEVAVQRLELAVRGLGATQPPARNAVWSEIPDEYYWAFERRMRGDADSVVSRLRAYEDLVAPLAISLRGADDPPPRWIDLGCGQGEFCALLRGWGWEVEGVDGSPAAVETCRARGIDVTLSDVLTYLESRPDDPVGGVSAIQLIEHLPRSAWVHLFEEIHRALAPGGALLLETINGQNVDAVADYFLADVTHTWPGHPETLKLMAEHAGFDGVEVRFLHEDHRGRAQDFTIWAVKPAS